MDIDMEPFGENLRAARKAAGLTQVELGALLDTDGSRVSDWERGRTEPGAFTLRRLAETLGTSTDALLGLAVDEDGDARYTLRVIRRLVSGDAQHTGWYLAPEPVGIAHDDLTLRQAA